jgi:hypothetical protein
MSSNAIKRLSFALSTAAKNLVFEILSGKSVHIHITSLLLTQCYIVDGILLDALAMLKQEKFYGDSLQALFAL